MKIWPLFLSLWFLAERILSIIWNWGDIFYLRAGEEGEFITLWEREGLTGKLLGVGGLVTFGWLCGDKGNNKLSKKSRVVCPLPAPHVLQEVMSWSLLGRLCHQNSVVVKHSTGNKQGCKFKSQAVTFFHNSFSRPVPQLIMLTLLGWSYN